MKKLTLLFSALLIITLSSCKKDYACTAIGSSGTAYIFNCTNCTSKDAKDYEKEILSQGYTSASCEKK